MNACANCGSRRAPGARFCTWCGTAFPIDRTQTSTRNALGVFAALGAFGLFGCMTTCVALILLLEVPDPLGLALSIIAAVVPAAFYSALVLYLDRNEKEPWFFLAGAFAWGAIVAVVFSYIFNSLVGIAVATAYGMEAGEFVSLAVAAPFFEETFKGAALLALLVLFRSHFDNVLDGIVYGALVGLGFAMTENIIYFGRAYFDSGVFGIGLLFVLRVVIGGLSHALYTAITGAAVGWGRAQYGVGRARYLVPAGGLLLAMILHSLWNTTAFIASRLVEDESLLVALVIIIVVEPGLFILPGLIAAIAIAVITSRRELLIIQHELRDEVDRGVLSPIEYEQVSNGKIRRQASLLAFRTGGIGLWLTYRRFVRLAARLAFQKYHASQGEIGRRGLRYLSPDDLRAEIVATRAEMYRRNPSLRTAP